MSENSRLDQRVGEHSTAVQAARDVTIHQGLSTKEVSDIMSSMVAGQLSVYREQARDEAERRFKEFREELLKSFGPEMRGNRQAFADPDFQFLLSDAQNAYARTGKEDVKHNLVELITERSTFDAGSRIAIVLNDAATKVPLLTEEEFSLLSLVFMVRHTGINSVRSATMVIEFIRNFWLPFFDPSIGSESSVRHLAAQSCGALEIASLSMSELLKNAYGGVLCAGLTRESIDSFLPGRQSSFDRLLCVNERNLGMLRFTVASRAEFETAARVLGLPDDDIDNFWNNMTSTVGGRDQLAQRFPEGARVFQTAFDSWENNTVSRISLTSVGIAIGHANASRRVKLDDSPLSIWIK